MFKSGIIFIFLTFSLVIQTTGILFIKSTPIGFIEGTYLWEILDGNKVVEKGKWIKR